MSTCPGCQKEPARSDFCEDCFLELGTAPPGRFQGVVSEGLLPSLVSSASPLGPNLSHVTFQPLSWGRRVLLPNLKKLALVACLALAVDLGYQGCRTLYRSHQRDAALAHLQSASQAQQQNQKGEAFRQAQAALSLAQDSGDAAVLGQVHQTLGCLAEARGNWTEAMLEYGLGLKERTGNPPLRLAIQRSLARIEGLVAVRELDKARAQLGRRQYAAALQSATRARLLFERNPTSPGQMADCQYVTGTIYEQLGLLDECRHSLLAALQSDPAFAPASQLLAQLPAPISNKDPFQGVRMGPFIWPQTTVSKPAIRLPADYRLASRPAQPSRPVPPPPPAPPIQAAPPRLATDRVTVRIESAGIPYLGGLGGIFCNTPPPTVSMPLPQAQYPTHKK